MSLLQAASKFWAGAPRLGSLGKTRICPEPASPLRSSEIWNIRSFADCVRCHPGGETYRAMSKLSFAAAIRAEKRTTNASKNLLHRLQAVRSVFMKDSPPKQSWPPAYRETARRGGPRRRPATGGPPTVLYLFRVFGEANGGFWRAYR